MFGDCIYECPCGSVQSVYSEGFMVCSQCGQCLDNVVYSETIPYQHRNPESPGVGYSTDSSTPCKVVGDRYRSEFHFNERIRQLCCEDPQIPLEPLREIRAEYEIGKYPKRHKLRRYHVFRICKATEWYDGNLGRVRSCGIYCERWKTLLRELKGTSPKAPYGELVRYLVHMFKHLRVPWAYFREMLPASKTKKKTKTRHNSMNFNYTFRKILESRDIYEFHDDFPTLKTPSKLHALDRVMEKCSSYIGMKFTRSVVIERPIIKNKFRNNRKFLNR